MLNKIWNRLLGKPSEGTEKKKSATDNVVDVEKKLLDAIVSNLKQFYGRKTFTDTVVLWISNRKPAEQSCVHDKTFEQRLRTELDNRENKVVAKAKFVFKTENPPEESGLAEIADGVWIQLLAEEKPKHREAFGKARITIAKDKGSLMKDEYILDADVQTGYNIGRGESNNNHIVIRDNDSLNSGINDCVSRRHAQIVFIAGRGFALKSLNETNRTIINRNGQRFDKLTDSVSCKLLRNNDEIELGDKDKPLLLKFEIILKKQKPQKQGFEKVNTIN